MLGSRLGKRRRPSSSPIDFEAFLQMLGKNRSTRELATELRSAFVENDSSDGHSVIVRVLNNNAHLNHIARYFEALGILIPESEVNAMNRKHLAIRFADAVSSRFYC